MQGTTTGKVRALLRMEGLAVLIAAAVAYNQLGFSWTKFAWLFLLPDLALLAYLAGARAGAIAYNTTHSYVGAIACLGAGFYLGSQAWLAAGLIWCAHIGFDRALSYGLKYASGFGFTHLGRIGRDARISGAVAPISEA